MGAIADGLIGINALAAAFLINAGLIKLVTPASLREAVSELLRVESALTPSRVRLFATVEITIGAALLVSPARMLASAAVAVLGLIFIVLGSAGRLAASSRPCGCIGGYSSRPFGVSSILSGLAIVGVLPVNAAVDIGRSNLGAEYSSVGLGVTSLCLLGLCICMNRRMPMSLWSVRSRLRR